MVDGLRGQRFTRSCSRRSSCKHDAGKGGICRRSPKGWRTTRWGGRSPRCTRQARHRPTSCRRWGTRQ